MKERVDRLLALEQETATEFGLDISDRRVKHVARLRLQSDDYTALVLSGKPYDFDVGLKIDAEVKAWLKEMMPEPGPEKLTVEFIDDVHASSGTCQVCGRVAVIDRTDAIVSIDPVSVEVSVPEAVVSEPLTACPAIP